MLAIRVYAPKPVMVPAAVPATATWKPVRRMQGKGTTDSVAFKIASPDWRINWRSPSTAYLKAGALEILVYDANGKVVMQTANKEGPARGVVNVQSTPGEYKLRIQTAGDWTLTIEDRR